MMNTTPRPLSFRFSGEFHPGDLFLLPHRPAEALEQSSRYAARKISREFYQTNPVAPEIPLWEQMHARAAWRLHAPLGGGIQPDSLRVEPVNFVGVNSDFDLPVLAYDDAELIRNPAEALKPQAVQEFVYHVIHSHLEPHSFRNIGLPRYDMEKAKYFGIPVSEITEKIYDRLNESQDEYQRQVDFFRGNNHGMKQYEFRIWLVKTLYYIEYLGLEKIDWKRVATAFPHYEHVTVDVNRDAADASFESLHADKGVKLPR